MPLDNAVPDITTDEIDLGVDERRGFLREGLMLAIGARGAILLCNDAGEAEHAFVIRFALTVPEKFGGSVSAAMIIKSSRERRTAS